MQTTSPKRSPAAPNLPQIAAPQSDSISGWENKNGLMRRTDKVHKFPRVDDVPLGVVRQRFYPEQWRRAVQTRMEALAEAHGQTVRWTGWDRSLPRLYLSSDQLTRALSDLIQLMARKSSYQPPLKSSLGRPLGPPLNNSGPENEMTLRVTWQSGATPSLLISLDHPCLHLSHGTMAAVNSPTLFGESQNSSDNAWIGLRSLMRGLGGGLTLRVRASGGTHAQLSIPTDDRHNLVRNWLEQLELRSRLLVGDMGDMASSRSEAGLRLSLHAIGRRAAETLSSLNAADIRLQSLASQQDLVYRAARGRWLWLTLYEELPSFIHRSEWQSQLVCRWNCPVSAVFSPNFSMARRAALSGSIVATLERILGNRVPPLDILPSTHSMPRRLRVDRPPAGLTEQTQRQMHAPRTQYRTKLNSTEATALAGRARWRYPI